MSELSETPFRVYGLDREDKLVHLASADDASLGDLLRDLRGQGRIGDGSRIGIMYRPVDGETGEWLVNPFAQEGSSATLRRAMKEREEGTTQVKAYTTEDTSLGEAQHVRVWSGDLWAFHTSYPGGQGFISLRNFATDEEEQFETTVRAVDTPEHVAYLLALAEEHVGGERVND